MHLYDFEVLRDGAVVAAKRAIRLADTRAAWPEIVRLASSFDHPGCKIRVLDEFGPNRHPDGSCRRPHPHVAPRSLRVTGSRARSTSQL